MSASFEFTSFPCCITHTLSESAQVGHYTVTASSDVNDAPSAFYFEGSDDGETWVFIDYREVKMWWANGTLRFPVEDSVPGYEYYRLRVISTPSGSLALMGFDLYERASTSECATRTETSEISRNAAVDKAEQAAEAAAKAKLNCAQLWNKTAEYTAECTGGTTGAKRTATGTGLSLISAADALDQAAAEAKALATAALECE